MHWRLYFAAITVTAGSAFHYGFQLVLTNPAEKAFIHFENASIIKHYSTQLKKDILDDIWSVTVASFFVGAIFGSFSINFLIENLGRKGALIATFVTNFVSILLAVLSYFIMAFELYAFSRIILGFSNAASLAICPLYLFDITPLQNRGKIGMSTGISVQFGSVLGSFIAMPQILGTFDRWWIIYLGEAGILFIALIILALFFPESSESLLKQGNEEKAINSIKFFHRCTNAEAVKILEEKKLHTVTQTKIGLIHVWMLPETQSQTIIAVIVMFGTMFSGISVLNSFAVNIFESVGLTSLTSSYANVGICILSFFAALISPIVIDRFGRRLLLLCCFLGLLICNIFIGVLLFAHNIYTTVIISILLIFFIALFLVLFSLGPGPLCYFITAELHDINSRSSAQTWTSFAQMTTRAIILAGFLPLKTALGSPLSYLILFIVPITIATIFLYFNLPETKNRTPKEVKEEITRLTQKGPAFLFYSAFPKHKNVSV
uniref:Major facilitator superfamily (MFS) profile domain-containing protein n=1 Tax=Panagrolaimus sp. PS1159 TaxID=55785 RepID=A0AC35FK20_9BILA